MNYPNLATTGARDNMGGTSVRLLYAPISYFAPGGIKKIPANPTSLEEKVTIALTHVFLAGKGFHTIRCILDTNKLKADPVGERGGRGIKEEYEAKVSGNTKEMAAFMAMCKNDEFVCLVPTHDGLYVQLGSEDLPAEILPGHDTGTVESGVNSMMVKITNFTMNRTFYAGAIQNFSTGTTYKAKVNILTEAVGDIITLSLFGSVIATAENETGDTWQDFLYKLYTAINDDPTSIAISAQLEGQNVYLIGSNFDAIDFNGAVLSVVATAGTPAINSTTPDHTFQLI